MESIETNAINWFCALNSSDYKKYFSIYFDDSDNSMPSKRIVEVYKRLLFLEKLKLL